MFDFVKRPVFLVIVVIALVVAVIWGWANNRKTDSQEETNNQTTTATQTTLSNLTNIDSSTIKEAFNAQLALADQKAQEADKKMQLAAIQVVLPGSLLPSSGNTYFVYVSPNDKSNNWVISISNSDNKFVRSRTAKEDYMGELTAINRSYLKTNYVAALQTAEKSGGLAARQSNPPTSVKITLKNAEPRSWLYWIVEYISANDAKKFQIDANTGSSVESESPSSSTSTTSNTAGSSSTGSSSASSSSGRSAGLSDPDTLDNLDSLTSE